jgi:sugar-specific transcriptional regulator TrmB
MGWTGYQAEAYVAVVRHGPLEPSDIVAMTDVPQGRVYNVMGELEGEAVNVQGRQPKRYTAQHPRSVLGDKRDNFTEKADAATDHLEQQHEIQRERDDHRHPAWVIPGISGTKRELLDAITDAEECVRLVERDGEWIQSNEVRDIGEVVDRDVEFEVIGWSRWSSKLNELVEELGETTEDEVLRVAGDIDDGPRVWTESSALSQALVAIYATSAARRLTLDVPLPDSQTAEEDIRSWLSKYPE